MSHPIAWRPNPGPQEALLACPDAIQDVFYGGARGGGKTAGLLGDFAAHAARYGKDAHGYLFRRTYPALEEVEKQALELYTKLGAVYNTSKHTFTFANGADLKLRYLEAENDYVAYLGVSMTWQGWDELTSWPRPEAVDKLWGTLRSAAGVPCVRRCTGNPGTVGQQWVHQRYVAPAEPMTPFRYQPQPTLAPDLWITAVFIPSRLEDNPALMENDPQYEQRLAASGSGELYRAWRFGDWSVTAGAMLSELREDIHRVVATPPLWWTEKVIVMDWGWEHDTVAGWFETESGHDGPARSRMYRELVVKHTVPAHVAQQVVNEATREELNGSLTKVVLDSAAWASPQDGGPSPAEQMTPIFQKAGLTLVPTVKGPGSVRNGCLLLHTYFDPRWTPPLLQVMENCPETWRQLTSIVRHEDPAHNEEPAKGQRDDAFTVVRYFVQSRPTPSQIPQGQIAVPGQHRGRVDPRTQAMIYAERAAEKKLMAVLDLPRTKKRRRPPLPWEA